MRYLLATLAISCGFAAAGQSKDAALTVLVTGNDVSPAVLTEMEREASTAFAPGALTLIWKTDADRKGDFVVNGRLALIHMRGQCVAEPAAGATSPPVVSGTKLGVTHIADGQVLPIADILCDAVRNFVGPELRRSASHNREELYGRALGRVLAHELYHIVLRSTEHGLSGLSRGEQRSADLLDPELSFQPMEDRSIAASAASYGRQSELDQGSR